MFVRAWLKSSGIFIPSSLPLKIAVDHTYIRMYVRTYIHTNTIHTCTYNYIYYLEFGTETAAVGGGIER